MNSKNIHPKPAKIKFHPDSLLTEYAGHPLLGIRASKLGLLSRLACEMRVKRHQHGALDAKMLCSMVQGRTSGYGLQCTTGLGQFAKGCDELCRSGISALNLTANQIPSTQYPE